MYPGKLFAEALIGNTQAGRNWIDYVDDTFTIAGQQRKRNATDRGVDMAPGGAITDGDAEML